MSDRLRKLLNLAFSPSANEGEANNAFNMARKMLGNKSIEDFISLDSETEKGYSCKIKGVDASYKDDYIEKFIKECNVYKIRISKLSIDSIDNIVTNPSTITFEYYITKNGQQISIDKFVNNYFEFLKKERNKQSHPFVDMANMANAAPRPVTPEPVEEKPKTGFWRKVGNWLRNN